MMLWRLNVRFFENRKHVIVIVNSFIKNVRSGGDNLKNDFEFWGEHDFDCDN